MKKHIRFSTISFLAAVSVAALWAAPRIRAQNIAAAVNADALVATVAGASILYRDVEFPLAQAQEKYKLFKQIQPSPQQGSEAPPVTVDSIQLDEEKRKLAGMISTIVHKQEIDSLNIAVTDAEVNEKWSQLKKKIDLNAAVQQERERASLLLQALELVYKQGKDPDDVYKQLLEKSMPSYMWAQALTKYRQPENLALLQRKKTLTVKDIDTPGDYVRAMVEKEKLDAAIDLALSKTDLKFAESLKVVAADVPNGQLKRTEDKTVAARSYVTSKRELWQIEQYEKASIKILNNRFADVLNRFVPGASSPK